MMRKVRNSLMVMLCVGGVMLGAGVGFGNEYLFAGDKVSESETIDNKTLESGIKQDNRNRIEQYGIGSVSKTFTAVAVMQLVEQGKIDLDTPVVQYLPEFVMKDERYRDITVRMLLDHTSGLMGSLYHNGIVFEDHNSYTHDMLLKQLSTQELKADPGSYMVYCNNGYALAELLVEKVTGMAFSDYLQQNICEPLQMSHTTTAFTKEDDLIPHAVNYLNGSIVVPWEGVTEVGSGGVRSTTEDLAKFSSIFMDDNEILSRKSVQEMTKDYYADTTYLNLPELKDKTAGLGFDYVQMDAFERYGIQAVGKGGDLDYQHANLTILPEEKMSASVLSSGGTSTFNQLVSQAVLEAALEVKGKISAETLSENALEEWEKSIPAEVEEIPENIKMLAGNYVGKRATRITFPEGNRMQITTLDREPQIVMELTYHADGWFYGDKEHCIGLEIMNAGEGHTGISKVKLMTEKDGKVYLYASTKGQYAGLGMYGYHEVFGTRVGTKLSEDADKAVAAGESFPDGELTPEESSAMEIWRSRAGKKYYLYDEDYASVEWTQGNQVIELKEIGVDGYIYGSGCMGVKEIIDESHLKSACIGRDMSTATYESKDGQEYLSIDHGGSTFICGDTMQELTPDWKEYTLTDESAKWFEISSEMERKQVKITVTGKGMAAVYDRYDQCIYTTFAQNGNQTVILPIGGKMVFAGDTSGSIKPSVQIDIKTW